ncbi:hypothetical protein ACVWWD_000386 [Mesorhizobium sp. URHB0026]|jgi:hypothetical protein
MLEAEGAVFSVTAVAGTGDVTDTERGDKLTRQAEDDRAGAL